MNYRELEEQLMKREKQATGSIQSNYQQAIRDIREVMRKYYDKYAINGELRDEELAKYDRRDKLNKELQNVVGSLWVANAREIRKNARDQYKQGFNGNIEILEEKADRKIQGEAERDEVQTALYALVGGMTLKDRLDRRKRDATFRVIESVNEMTMQDVNITTLMKKVQEELEKDGSNAQTILQTEGHRMKEQAKFKSAKHAENQGLEIRKKWVSMRDERVRATHEDMDDKYDENGAIPIDEDFINQSTGGRGPTPGNLQTAEDDVNCRCETEYIVVND